MPSVTPRRPLRHVLAAAAVLVAPALLPSVAAAQEPGGRTVVGELVQAWPESAHAAHAGHDDAADEQPLTWVETVDGDAVRLPTEDVTGLPVGATVEVTVGHEVADEAADHGLDPARELLDGQVIAAPVTVQPPARRITNEVTVALVAPAGARPDGVTVGQVVRAVDSGAARFWAGQSGGAISLGVTASHGWTTTVAGCAEPGAMWAEAAAKVGFTAGPGKHLLLYVTGAAADCSYGLAQVGSAPSSGGRVYVTDVLPSLIAHELGHNFGLGHSSALSCAHGAETGGCDTLAYGDHYDVMGSSWEQIGSLNVLQADRLGVLPDEAVHTVPATAAAAEVTLAPLTGQGVRAVRLVDEGGSEYWLELRTAAGQDAWLGGRGNRFDLEAGVLVRRAGPWPHASLLLDPTPRGGPGGDLLTALPVGRTVTLGGGAFQVVVRGVTAAGATIDVRPLPAVESGAGSDPSPQGTGTRPDGDDVVPEILAATEEDAEPAPVGAPEPAAVEVPEPAAEVPAPRAPAGVAPERVVLTAAPQAVVEASSASSVRSLAVPAVGAALGCTAFVLVRRLVRMRTPR